MDFYQPITITASATLDRDTHGGAVTRLSAAAGLTVTLPASTGKGDVYKLFVLTTVTSNNYVIQVANASDTIAGIATTATTTTGAGTHEAAGGTDDTITLNGTTTGGIVGSYIELEDVSANLWRVNAHLAGSGVLATPFSAAVS